jgi:hypothetical protein
LSVFTSRASFLLITFVSNPSTLIISLFFHRPHPLRKRPGWLHTIFNFFRNHKNICQKKLTFLSRFFTTLFDKLRSSPHGSFHAIHDPGLCCLGFSYSWSSRPSLSSSSWLWKRSIWFCECRSPTT